MSETFKSALAADYSEFDKFPLSYAQERLWFLDQLEPNSPAYIISAALRISGHLDRVALHNTFNLIVDRHESLRTSFSILDSHPVQIIAPSRDHLLDFIDLSHLDPVDREHRAKAIATEEAHRPFDLSRDPLLRTSLLKLDDLEHVLIVTMHHIISDGWSIAVMIREIADIYSALVNGQQVKLQDLAIQYADYAVWQREWLEGEEMDRQLRYWREQFLGEIRSLDLPTDRVRPARQSYRGAREYAKVSQEVSQKLREMSRRESVTMYMLMLAAYKVMLMRLSGEEDVRVGTPIAGRNRKEVEGLIGFFVNTLVMRTDLSGNPTFTDLLKRVKKVAVDAYAHQDLPFERLVEELRPERDLSRSPLFQVNFALQGNLVPDIKLPGVTITLLDIIKETAKFDLDFSVSDTDDGFLAGLVYKSDLFEPATITRLLQHFKNLLEGIAANPDQRIWDLPLLSPLERHQLIVDWNNTRTDIPNDYCIHELFEAQVERTPAALAVAFEDERLTYRELNLRANQLAHHLQDFGVGPEVPVGLYMERSVEMLVGLLGILKAGAAYVPIDPAYPAKRVQFMLDDIKAPVLLTQKRLAALLPLNEAQLICLDSDWEFIARSGDHNPASKVTLQNLAYVIYTSGSTGKPKGVEIQHSSLTNFLNSMRAVPGLTKQDTLLSVTTLSFDIAALEIFLPLTVGARLVLISAEIASDGVQLQQRIESSNATVMQATPATWKLLLESGWQGNTKLKVLCGGEALPASLADSLLQKSGALWNMYGPVEATIWSTASKLESLTGPVSIGNPIANTQIYILDSHAQLVPVGVVGELYIGGSGLARGYLNRGDLTAEKFIPDAFGVEPGARLYRTGDLARYLPDRNIEYIGRIDHQVKIRGYRIELAEIEEVLKQHSGIEDAVVLARKDAHDESRLAAYVVTRQQPAPTINSLREFLSERLPEYMVPTAFVLLDKLPLTPNGKVDRSALLALEVGRPEGDKPYQAPSTELEILLAKIWQEILNIESPGIHDNFFDLGGDSIRGAIFINEIQNRLGEVVYVVALFDAPTIAKFADYLAERYPVAVSKVCGVQVSPDSRDVSQWTPIRRMTGDEYTKLPVSFAQQRLWFLDQLEPDNSSYNIPSAVWLGGDLNVEAIERSIQEIVRRHEALRTTFEVIDGQPMQVIAPEVIFTVPVIDLTEMREQEKQSEWQRIAREEANRPFDLQRGPLLRMNLVRLDETTHLALLTMHHIVSDGWSMGVLINELATLYEAFAHNAPNRLAELEIQYADFAVWQREWLRGEVLAGQVEYWKQQLGGSLPVLELPTDRPRPAVQSFKGRGEKFALNKSLSQSLQALSNREGVTLFMTLVAAFKTLLCRYSGQEDILVGAPIANRNRAELEKLIGVFVNTLVLRTDLSGDPSFQQLLKRVRDVTLAAYANQDLPFEKLVEELHSERDLSRAPLFQVMFILQNAPKPTEVLSGLTLSPVQSEIEAAKFDLTLSVTETEEGLRGSLNYSSDLFTARTIRRLIGHFQNLLEAVAIDPQQRISELPLLSDAELEELTSSTNDTGRSYGEAKTICQLFEDQAEAAPDAVAFVFEGESLNYEELNSRANQLAHYLLSLGVEPEDRVGICVNRSLDMVIGLLGILKSGGAYVPLDPTYPLERLSFMLEDAQASVLLTQEELLDDLPEQQAKVVCINRDWPIISQQSERNPARNLAARNLAYVIYTSGSTGKPKGVLGQHGAAVNRFNWMWERYPFEADEVCCQKTSLSFVDSVWEIFGPLLSGIKSVIVHNDDVKDPERLIQVLAENKVTRVVLVPSLLRAMLESRVDLQTALPGLRYCVSSGEALSLELSQRFAERMPQSTLINLYGSSEVSADATYWQVNLNSTDNAIAIGSPIANTQAYVLDNHLRVVPIGVVGELFIGGEGLARGYHNRPELTAEKFIPNPFSQQPGGRLFKTGDLARFRDQGELEYIGRADHQVKIRGHRIELGEIEAQLLEHSSVSEAVVLASHDMNGDYRLIAYVVAGHLAAPTVTELYGFLKMRLPDYMIPGAFMFLEALPLLPNGKIDKRALPDVETSRPLLEQSFIAARTPIEELISAIFSHLLLVDSVGINDSFFELGGHSLLATQLVSRLRDAFGIDVALRKVFQEPTVAALALYVEEARRQATGISADEIKPVARLPLMPVSFSQQRLWFMDRMEPGSPFYNITTAVRVIGNLDEQALERSFIKVVDRHEVLRTRFVELDGRPMQQIDERGNFKLEVIKLEGASLDNKQEQAKQIAQQQAATGFDLSKGGLLRVTSIEISQQERLLVVVMHHIISDGWSIGVMIRELGQIYEAECRAEQPAIEELKVQYADYALWQRERLQGEVLDRQLTYWKQQLAGAPPSIDLPTDFTRPAVESFRGGVESITFSVELTNKIRKLGQQQGATLFMTLLAGFNTLLYRYTLQEDIVVGSPVAGRNHIEIEPLIGFFVNTLVLRTDLSGEPTFQELMMRVREMTLEAYTHQELPFEKLVEELQPERDLSRQPLFQVMFMLANAQAKQQELSELSMRLIELDNKTSKFDLTLEMRETDGGLTALIDYNTDLFEQASITRLLSHFHSLLKSIADDPSLPISSFTFLSDLEITHLLFDINHNDADFNLDQSIVQIFEQVVEASPLATALEYEGTELTYRQLNSRANQLARFLIKQGVGADQVIGVCMERSIEMVVAILGILKSGAAYAPFDPSYPKQRLATILNQMQVRLLLSQQPLVDGLQDLDAEVICIDDDWNDIAREDDHNPDCRILADNLAYIIHTSGSTGLPKGVMGSHKSALNRFNWMWERYPFEADEVCCQKTSLSFVDSVWEIFGPLLSGIKTIIIADEIVKDPGRLVETCAADEVTRIVLVPSLLRVILDSHDDLRSKLPRLKYCVSSGEALPSDLASRFTIALPDCTLLNLYGSSEVAADATSYNVSTGTFHRSVPIGTPISNTEAYLLDHHLNPVPIGASGELFIAGEGLARGYFNSPDLTAQRFIPNPFSQQPGGRLFRTGDLARYLPDGALEYLGRIDQQVKIRGYRIEPGEIESVLANHPALRESVVVAREDAAGDKRLVAYLIANQEPAPSVSEIRAYLTGLLPAHMVPSAFVIMEQFPLTRSGKIDKRALPDVETSRPLLEQSFIAARTPIEELISAIFSHLLNVDSVGINDSFFELGGHSLLATQLVSRLRDALGIDIPLRKVFESPTVAALALYVEEARRQADGIPLDQIKPVEREALMPVSFSQQRLWFMDRMEPGSPFYNIVAAVRIIGDLDEVALERSFIKIVDRHEALRTRFVEVDGRPMQQIDEQGNFKLQVVRLDGMSQEQRQQQAKQLADQEAGRGFDLAKGGLLRVTAIEINEQERLLVVVMHHIISDGWSIGVMIRELGQIYEAECRAEQPAIEELKVQYADYALWQRERLQGEILDRQLLYWKQQLEDAPALELPIDRPRPAVQRYYGAREAIKMPKSLSTALKSLGQRESASLYMVLMAAFKTLLYRYTGQDDILVGSPIANRTRSEIENLIGFFVNTLLIRTDLSGNPSFRELLSRVREVALEAYTHQELPFEKLVEELQPERDLSRQPLFQVMFVLQNAPSDDLRLSDLTISYLPADTRTSKFDLTLAMTETDAGLTALIDYNTDLFEQASITRLLSHFHSLLKSIADDPSLPISSITFLSDLEITHLLFDINHNDADFNLDQSIVQIFEQVVEASPLATALEYEGTGLTYRQLNSRANQLARFLIKQGVGADQVIGVCMERSIEMVVAILGILKSSAAYLPLDPAYPRERLTFMLNDAAVQVLLTQQRLLRLSLKKDLDVIELDTEWSLIAQENAENIKDKAKAENLAYVIYTSGSTGDPKGTMITHRGVCNTLLWRIKTFSLNEKDRILQTISFAFDPSVWQIFGALLSGARLVLPRPEALKDAAYIIKFIADREITITDFPPSLLQVLLDEQHLEECRSLKYLFSGGESLSPAIVERFYSRLNSELYNQYGPTETTIDATYWKCLAGVDDGVVPIGRPISNTQVYLLDNNLRLVPVGVAGHLHIGGEGLARGYLNLPDLTAEKFIPNPFSLTEGSRLYRTGDRARYRASGEIEFLGRIDGQVKLRGYRIEVGEIETRLCGHKGVRETAVILRDDQDAGKKLVAYVSARQDYIKERERQAGTELQAERVEQWKAIHDQEISSSSPAHQDPTFNIAGWSSSYTGLAIPAEEMREWVEQTVARITELKPERVMEIGCGTGLILFRVAPGCSTYTARDFSQTSLDYIERVMKAGSNHLGQVRLEMREAVDFRGVGEGEYDAVILNSVVQYFPSMDYLNEVMKQAVRAVKSGGFIYIGDVRRMELQEAFHASVERQRNGAAMKVTEIREKIDERMNEERELVVSEKFFEQLKREEPRIAEVEIRLKRGERDNELTKFRYDVIAHIGREDERAGVKEIDWKRDGMTVEKLSQVLRGASEERIKVKGIINSRVEMELRLVEEVKRASRDERVDEIWKRISEENRRGEEPERMVEIGEEEGYRVGVRWGEETKEMEVEYRRGERIWKKAEERKETEKIQDIRKYGNDPLKGIYRRKLSKQLREYLQERVPEIMVPGDIVVMDDLPKTTSGKIDRRALPAPSAYQAKESTFFVAPQSPVEESLAGIWRELLGIDRVGVDDDFFVLGGHSLLATQLISRVRTIFDLEVSLQDFFMAPSIKKMAEVIEEAMFAKTSSSKIDELLDMLEASDNEPQ